MRIHRREVGALLHLGDSFPFSLPPFSRACFLGSLSLQGLVQRFLPLGLHLGCLLQQLGVPVQGNLLPVKVVLLLCLHLDALILQQTVDKGAQSVVYCRLNGLKLLSDRFEAFKHFLLLQQVVSLVSLPGLEELRNVCPHGNHVLLEPRFDQLNALSVLAFSLDVVSL